MPPHPRQRNDWSSVKDHGLRDLARSLFQTPAEMAELDFNTFRQRIRVTGRAHEISRLIDLRRRIKNRDSARRSASKKREHARRGSEALGLIKPYLDSGIIPLKICEQLQALVKEPSSNEGAPNYSDDDPDSLGDSDSSGDPGDPNIFAPTVEVFVPRSASSQTRISTSPPGETSAPQYDACVPSSDTTSPLSSSLGPDLDSDYLTAPRLSHATSALASYSMMPVSYTMFGDAFPYPHQSCSRHSVQPAISPDTYSLVTELAMLADKLP